jgi:hypothetical protein
MASKVCSKVARNINPCEGAMTMLPWEKGPIEIANLFNPAFLSLLLQEGSLAYQAETQNGFPFELAPLLVTLSLHKETRDLIPKTISTKMHTWLMDHPELKINCAKRIINMNPYTLESVSFGLKTGMISIDENGRICSSGGSSNFSKLNWSAELEPAKCLQRAAFLGRWLAKTGDVTTIYIMWGIRP